MNKINIHLVKGVVAACILFATSCSWAASAGFAAQTILVGSTPGSDSIKALLSIDSGRQVDFIRWTLAMDGAGNSSKTFTLNIEYGESNPNTNGFREGGERRSFDGVYTVSKGPRGEVYRLTGDGLSGSLSMLKLSENLFHLLTSDNRLMAGTGGWSLTLNRKGPAADSGLSLTSWTTSFQNDRSAEVIFEGRTPCREVAEAYSLTLERECNKLKWKLTLNRDPKTNEPSGYTLQRTLERSRIINGNWTIIKGTKANPEALILRLDPDNPEKMISFLVGDENVLFFLDKKSGFFTGNSDFSFTLNRRPVEATK